MSDSSIALKPVIEEPSKPIPPSNASASSVALIENAFSWPRMSVNHRRMKRMSLLRDDREDVVGGRGLASAVIGGERYWHVAGGRRDARQREADDARPGRPGPWTRRRVRASSILDWA